MAYYRNLRISFCLMLMCLCTSSSANASYTVLNNDKYHETIAESRTKISDILNQLQNKRHLNANTQIAFIADQLSDIPYIYQNAMGEGDWQPTSKTYQGDAIHLRQNPVYRMDGLNCQTLVQVAMALYHARNLDQFDKNYLKIAYGSAGNPDGEVVRFYNRNNFIEADFNPVNQRNGWLQDVTSKGELAPYAEYLQVNITRKNWFLHQRFQRDHIEVLDESSGDAMLSRFNTIYKELSFPRFESEDISMSYLPKEKLVIRKSDDSFIPNQALLNLIPTPAIAEIVRDPDKWNYYGIKIKNITGSEIAVSHLGLLYRKNFKKDELIYQKTQCKWNVERKKICEVTPVRCEKKNCQELMFTHATNGYSRGYYWYSLSDGKYICSPVKPGAGTAYTSCNRVVSVPFYDYLTDYQSGNFTVMDVKSIVGIHIEKLT